MGMLLLLTTPEAPDEIFVPAGCRRQSAYVRDELVLPEALVAAVVFTVLIERDVSVGEWIVVLPCWEK